MKIEITKNDDSIILYLFISLSQSYMFCNVFFSRLVYVKMVPEKRQAELVSSLQYSAESYGAFPCGGYSRTYSAMCDYHQLPFMDDIAWVNNACSF